MIDPEAEPTVPPTDEQTKDAWADAAREVLVETAGRYHEVITRKDLAAEVQERTGLHSAKPPHLWVEDVLARVAQECTERNEPLLTSLCVNTSGSVGEGYAATVESLTGSRPADPDDHAAGQRLECHRAYDAVGLPAHGGTKALTVQLSASRTRARKRHHAEKPAAVCPTCQMALPATGECDNCG